MNTLFKSLLTLLVFGTLCIPKLAAQNKIAKLKNIWGVKAFYRLPTGLLQELSGPATGISFLYRSNPAFQASMRMSFDVARSGSTNTVFNTFYVNGTALGETQATFNNVSEMSFSLGYDFFVIESLPQLYISPTFFAGKREINCTYVKPYATNTYDFPANFGGFRLTVGGEYRMSKVRLFAELSAAYEVSQHMLIYDLNPNQFNFVHSQQLDFGVGVRF
jgi:hypothetical protein